jgi:gliding motility-associated-like protein
MNHRKTGQRPDDSSFRLQTFTSEVWDSVRKRVFSFKKNSMKKNMLFLLVLTVPQMLLSQNLVPNPSFEEHKTCEFVFSAFDTSFFNPSVVNNWCSGNFSGTPDYFNLCQIYNEIWNCSVPINDSGQQYPYQGNSYAGIGNISHFTSNIETREYLQTKLLSRLSNGTTYCIGFYISLAEFDSTILLSDISIVATKNWGLLLSETRPFNPIDASSTSSPTAFTLLGDPQLKISDFVKDTINWVLISGNYTATGNEEWITIGNFNLPEQTPLDTVYHGSAPNIASYYFIDNVFVIPMDDGGLLPNDSFICTDSFPFELSASSGFSNYLWSNGDTTQKTTIQQVGIYSIKASYEGCQITDTIHIGALDIPELYLTDISLCENELPQSYSVPSGLNFSTYLWSDGSVGKDIILQTTTDIVLKASGVCGDATDTLHISIDTIPIVNLGEDRSLCENATSILLYLSNISGILPNYLWSNGLTTDKIQVNNVGIYTLTTQNRCGTYSDDITLTGCPPLIYVPNVFNPIAINSENTEFKAFVSNAEIISMDIYDRWGEHIFTQNDVVKGWDGTWRNKAALDGVYAYLIKYKNLNNGEILNINGTVLLLNK